MKSSFSCIYVRILVVASLALPGACSGIESISPAGDVEKMTVVATVEDTRTVNEGVSTRWLQGDKASLIHCRSGKQTYYASCFSYGSDGKFSGEVSDKSSLNDWYFAYPYISTNTSPGSISVYVNPTPVQSGNGSTAHLCGEGFPIFGICKDVPSSDTISMSMKNSLAVAKVVIKNTLDGAITVKKVKIESSSPISGDFSVDLSSGEPVWNPKQGAGNSVTLTVDEATALASGESAIFYIGCVPHTSTSQAITVTAAKSDGKSVRYYVSRENDDGDKFKAGLFKVMKLNFDDKHPVPVNYVKVTESCTDWSGTYLFVSQSNSKAFAAFSDVSDYAADVVIQDGKIASDGKVDKYALTVTSTGKSHPAISNSPAYDVRNSNGKYIYWSTNNGGLVLDDNNIFERHPSNNYKDTQYGHCFEYSNSGVKVIAAGFKSGFTKYYLRYISGAFSYSSSSSTVQLYKLDGEARKHQTLTFSSPSVTWKVGSFYEIGGIYDVQHAEGAKTPVTYSSGNTAVAEISGNLITVKDYGTAVITANAEGDDDYYAASATYTLTIGKEGAFNLENESVMEYMDEAQQQYTDENYKTLTIVKNYAGGQSTTCRKDSPAPVTLSWDYSSSATKSVNIYNDASMTDLEVSATTSSSTIDILNLIPGRTYWYSVSTDSDGIISSGKFDTEGRRRMLLVSDTRAKGHANNCRDLGGLVTTDGKKLKYGIIFRGSNMDMTTDAEKSIILDYMNVGIDIDLRTTTASYTSTGEDGKATNNNPWTGEWIDKVTYCNDGAFNGTFNESFKVGMKEYNARFTTMFTKLLNTIKTGKSAYIHCHVGADRTGYVCLILEMVLGVSPKDCSIDFELTSFSVVGDRLRTGDSSHNMCKDALNYINNYRGSTYKEKAYNILTDYGISDAQIQEFRSIMLE